MEELTREQASRLISEIENLYSSIVKLDTFIQNVDTNNLTNEMKEYLDICNKQICAMSDYENMLRERLVILLTKNI